MKMKKILLKLFDAYKIGKLHGPVLAVSAFIQNLIGRQEIKFWLYGTELSLPNEEFTLKYIWDSIPKLQKLVSEVESDEMNVVIDVGSNCGIFCALAGMRWPEAKYYAFEPTPGLENFIVSNTIPLDIKISMFALSDREGISNFFVNPRISQTNSLVSSAAEEFATQEPPSQITVKTTTLDKFCDEHELDHIDFLKVDIQGGESLFLAGSMRSLRRSKYAAFEISFLDHGVLDVAEQLRREFGNWRAVNFVTAGADILFWRRE